MPVSLITAAWTAVRGVAIRAGLFHSALPQFPLLQHDRWDSVLPCEQLQAVLMGCREREV